MNQFIKKKYHPLINYYSYFYFLEHWLSAIIKMINFIIIMSIIIIITTTTTIIIIITKTDNYSK